MSPAFWILVVSCLSSSSCFTLVLIFLLLSPLPNSPPILFHFPLFLLHHPSYSSPLTSCKPLIPNLLPVPHARLLDHINPSSHPTHQLLLFPRSLPDVITTLKFNRSVFLRTDSLFYTLPNKATTTHTQTHTHPHTHTHKRRRTIPLKHPPFLYLCLYVHLRTKNPKPK